MDEQKKFRFYIYDTFDGRYIGTDSENTAREFSSCEDFFVLDVETGKWMDSPDHYTDIQEVTPTE